MDNIILEDSSQAQFVHQSVDPLCPDSPMLRLYGRHVSFSWITYDIEGAKMQLPIITTICQEKY